MDAALAGGKGDQEQPKQWHHDERDQQDVPLAQLQQYKQQALTPSMSAPGEASHSMDLTLDSPGLANAANATGMSS